MSIQETTSAEIESILRSQREYFSTGKTKEIQFRIVNLRKFKSQIVHFEKKIVDALWADLHKSYEEAYMTEIVIVKEEINSHLRNLKRWSRAKKVCTPLPLLPSSSKIIQEPLGNTLIIAPWNYPFQLLMAPLVSAISSGCCAVLKPSPYTPAISKVMEELIQETFDPSHITVVQGGRAVNQILLEQRFDLIFFTGSPALGKLVMKAAAEHLTPVVLELGGKSPCIVDEDANIELAAKRIAWGKCINAGQTCIAPDYLFVHRSVKEQLVKKMASAIEEMYGKELKESRFYPRIVNDQAMERLQKLMLHGKIVYGGEVDPAQKFIHPTIIEDIQPDFPIMQEEIFGPLIPVMTFDHIDQAVSYINRNEKPLALYYFGKNLKAKKILQQTTSGGGCINDTLMHIANHHLPFGGVGNSGMGAYHGQYGFKAFSHERPVVTSPTWIDLPFKYPPFRYFELVRKFILG